MRRDGARDAHLQRSGAKAPDDSRRSDRSGAEPFGCVSWRSGFCLWLPALNAFLGTFRERTEWGSPGRIMAPAEDGPEPRAAQVDDPPSFVKGVKGRKDMHVPKAVWRQHRPRKPRAADHVEGTGSKGGPTSARVINGVLRSLEELLIACPRNLKLGPRVRGQYFEHVRRRDVAKAALDALLRDPSVSADDKHAAAASFSMNHGPAAFNYRRCWLLRGCCVCRMPCPARARAGPAQDRGVPHHRDSAGEQHRPWCPRASAACVRRGSAAGRGGAGGCASRRTGGWRCSGRGGAPSASGTYRASSSAAAVKGGDGDERETAMRRATATDADGGGRSWPSTARGRTRNMLKRLPKDRVVLVSLPPRLSVSCARPTPGSPGGPVTGVLWRR